MIHHCLLPLLKYKMDAHSMMLCACAQISFNNFNAIYETGIQMLSCKIFVLEKEDFKPEICFGGDSRKEPTRLV